MDITTARILFLFLTKILVNMFSVVFCITVVIMKVAKVRYGHHGVRGHVVKFNSLGLTLCSSRSEDGGKTWSALAPIERPETEVDCAAYNVDIGDGSQKDARQSHDGYQLLVGDRIYLFYGEIMVYGLVMLKLFIFTNIFRLEYW